jgi:hypothetical protein
MPWQVVGQEKLRRMANGPWRGGFLVDAVGLRKSPASLLAALRVKREKNLPGYVLVTCPKQCVAQWYQEVLRHFIDGRRPKAIVLDTTTYPVKMLLHHDFVICSHSFLRNRWKDIIDHHTYTLMANVEGLEDEQTHDSSSTIITNSPYDARCENLARFQACPR